MADMISDGMSVILIFSCCGASGVVDCFSSIFAKPPLTNNRNPIQDAIKETIMNSLSKYENDFAPMSVTKH